MNNGLEKLIALAREVVIATKNYSASAQGEMETLERLEILMEVADCQDKQLIPSVLTDIADTIEKSEVVGKIFSCLINAFEAAGVINKNIESESDSTKFGAV